MGVQVPQGLRGIWGGVHVGNRLTEGIGSCFLGLDATSSPAFSIQPLGDVLEVPLVVGGQVPISVLFIGTPNVAGVVKSEPCGLLYKMRNERSGLGSTVRDGDGCSSLTLFPTDSLPRRATFVCCIRWGG